MLIKCSPKNLKNMNKRVKLFILLLEVLAGFFPLLLRAQDSLKVSAKRSHDKELWNPFNTQSLALKAKLFYPDDTSVSANVPQKNVFVPKYYDLKKVFPDNPLMMDYRYSSYYTPKIVNDQLAFMMQRPRPDTFLPWPSLILLGAYAAYQYLMHQEQFEVKARDYLLEPENETVMLALWKKSPRTVNELLKNPQISVQESYNTLVKRLEILEDKLLVKSKTIEKGPIQYFPAQTSAEVIKILSNAMEDLQLTKKERQYFANLIKKLKSL